MQRYFSTQFKLKWSIQNWRIAVGNIFTCGC